MAALWVARTEVDDAAEVPRLHLHGQGLRRQQVTSYRLVHAPEQLLCLALIHDADVCLLSGCKHRVFKYAKT